MHLKELRPGGIIRNVGHRQSLPALKTPNGPLGVISVALVTCRTVKSGKWTLSPGISTLGFLRLTYRSAFCARFQRVSQKKPFS